MVVGREWCKLVYNYLRDMPENIMKTLWDESDDLHDETMSTNSCRMITRLMTFKIYKKRSKMKISRTV